MPVLHSNVGGSSTFSRLAAAGHSNLNCSTKGGMPEAHEASASGPSGKATTTTGAVIAHAFSLCPHVQQVAAHVLPERRVGPLTVDERQGRPYAGNAFQREGREVARAAGIPDHIWNMDARAGAITEAEDAGAGLDAIRATAAHRDAKTTARYSRGAVGEISDGRGAALGPSGGEEQRLNGDEDRDGDQGSARSAVDRRKS